MKIVKYSLLLLLFISSACFGNQALQEQVILPSMIDVVTFCSSDKNCNSITPIINQKDVSYAVKYEEPPLVDGPPINTPTDPTGDDDD